MQIALAIFGLVLGLSAFGYGFITEWRQSRESGPVAIVPTLPFAVQAALLLSLAIGNAPWGVPWWGAILCFPILLVGLGKLILMAHGRRD